MLFILQLVQLRNHIFLSHFLKGLSKFVCSAASDLKLHGWTLYFMKFVLMSEARVTYPLSFLKGAFLFFQIKIHAFLEASFVKQRKCTRHVL